MFGVKAGRLHCFSQQTFLHFEGEIKRKNKAPHFSLMPFNKKGDIKTQTLSKVSHWNVLETEEYFPAQGLAMSLYG